jgi:hypothetical protein
VHARLDVDHHKLLGHALLEVVEHLLDRALLGLAAAAIAAAATALQREDGLEELLAHGDEQADLRVGVQPEEHWRLRRERVLDVALVHAVRALEQGPEAARQLVEALRARTRCTIGTGRKRVR